LLTLPTLLYDWRVRAAHCVLYDAIAARRRSLTPTSPIFYTVNVHAVEVVEVRNWKDSWRWKDQDP